MIVMAVWTSDSYAPLPTINTFVLPGIRTRAPRPWEYGRGARVRRNAVRSPAQIPRCKNIHHELSSRSAVRRRSSQLRTLRVMAEVLSSAISSGANRSECRAGVSGSGSTKNGLATPHETSTVTTEPRARPGFRWCYPTISQTAQGAWLTPGKAGQAIAPCMSWRLDESSPDLLFHRAPVLPVQFPDHGHRFRVRDPLQFGRVPLLRCCLQLDRNTNPGIALITSECAYWVIACVRVRLRPWNREVQEWSGRGDMSSARPGDLPTHGGSRYRGPDRSLGSARLKPIWESR